MKSNGQLKVVGKNIRDARRRRGLRQVDVNEKIGVNYRHYQNIEAGRINITVSTLCRLAGLFGTSASDLLKDVCI